MSRYAVLAAALLLALTACGGKDEPAAKASTSAPASASPSPSGSPTTDLSQAEIQAKVAAGAPPKNLTWNFPSVPSTWKPLQGGTGVLQWQVGSSACAVQLNQPSGVGTGPTPTTEDVADQVVSTIGAAIPGTPTAKVLDRSRRTVPDQVTGLDGAASTTFASRTVAFGTDSKGYFLGYRNGDFALELAALCGQGQWAANKAEIESFVASLSAVTTY